MPFSGLAGERDPRHRAFWKSLFAPTSLTSVLVLAAGCLFLLICILAAIPVLILSAAFAIAMLLFESLRRVHRRVTGMILTVTDRDVEGRRSVRVVRRASHATGCAVQG